MTEETLINEKFIPDAAPSQPIEPQIDPELKRDLIVEAADEMKAHNIAVLDVREVTTLADFFVMCSGTSTTHIQSIAQGVRDRLREGAQQRARAEGDSASLWIVLDYGDVILHVFDDETREFYDLERLWADARASFIEAPDGEESDESDGEGSESRIEQSPARQNI